MRRPLHKNDIKGGSSKRRKKWILIAVGSLLVTVFGWALLKYYWLAPQDDRRSFSVVENALDQVTGQLVNSGTKAPKEKECARAKEKYGNGALVCTIKVYIPTKEVPGNFEEISNAFDSINTFKKNSEQDRFLQYSYKDINCSVQESGLHYSIVCGRAVSRAIY